MEKTPPCGLNRKFLTLIYIILFQFSVLWFGLRYYFHVHSISPAPELLRAARSELNTGFHHLDQIRGHVE